MDEEHLTETENHPSNNHPGHEATDAEIRPIIIFIASLGVFIIIAMFVMSWLLNFMERQHQAEQREISPLADQEQVPPQPRLQANPALDLESMQQREEELLNNYQWVDENAGTFRIPIERAIEIIAENGLPARTSTDVQETQQAVDENPSEDQEGSR